MRKILSLLVVLCTVLGMGISVQAEIVQLPVDLLPAGYRLAMKIPVDTLTVCGIPAAQVAVFMIELHTQQCRSQTAEKNGSGDQKPLIIPDHVVLPPKENNFSNYSILFPCLQGEKKGIFL